MRLPTLGIHRTLISIALLTMPLPTLAADLVGTIPGTFDVTQTGVATYTIPIELRTGTGGMRPPLSLRYTHRGGNGVAGQNWALTGISRIDRCRKTLDQDGAAGGVKYDSNDRFCLDGRRLVAISGTYGASLSEYRTEIDSFRKIVAHGYVFAGPQYFVVTDRDGTKHYYGHEHQSSLTHPVTNAYRFWARYRTEDTYGNRIDYFYTTDAFTGEFLLDRVDYTSNPTQALSARYRVGLTYEARPPTDERDGYRYGAIWSEDKRLKKITHSLLGTGAGTIHEYTLNYATSASGRSQLTSVQQCRGVNCFPVSTFAWQGATVGWNSLTSTGNSSSGQAGPKVGDFNGDGQKDLFVNTGGNWQILLASGGTLSAPFDTGVAAQDWSAAQLGDFDGDGKTDILFRGSDSDWHVYRSTGVATTGQAYTDIDTGESTSGVNSFAFQDVDGDGRDDVLYQVGQNVYLRKSEGTDLATTVSTVYTSSSMTSISGWNPVFSSEPVLDFDGDGLSDLVENRVEVIDIDPENIVYKYYHVPLTFNGTTYSAGPLITVFNPTLRYVDINGDGLLDVAYPDFLSNGIWYIRISNGTGFGSAVSTTLNCAPASHVVFADYDGDRRMDFICPSTGNWTVHKSTGSNFSSSGINIGSFGGAMLGTPMDVTGNGQDDIVVRASNLWQLRKHNSGLVDVVTRFEDGLGNYAEPVHESISISSHYGQHFFGTPPNERSYQEPLYVVTDYTMNDGKGSAFTNTFEYKGAKMHNRGRGFLGFREVREFDNRDSGYRLYFRMYEQDFPYTGMLDLEQVRANMIANRRSEVNGQRASNSPHPGVYFVRNEHVRTTIWDPGDGVHAGQVIRETIDDPTYNNTWGFVTSRTITTTSPIRTTDRFETTINYTQNPATSSWCLDIPSATSITRSDHNNAAVTRTFTHTYDETKCRLLSTTNTTSADNDKKLKATYTYDAYGNIETQTLDNVSGNASDRVTRFHYDSYGEKPERLVRETSGGPNPETQWMWDYVNGQPISVTNAQGQTTSSTFDGLGRVDVETYPDGTTVNYDYIDCPSCWVPSAGRFEVRVAPSNGPDSRLFFDSYGRNIGSLQYLPGATTQSAEIVHYDQQGRIARETGPYVYGENSYFTEYEYDLIGRLSEINRPISEATPSGALTLIDYDGFEQTVTNSEAQVTTYRFDSGGQIDLIADDLGGQTTYVYAAFGQLRIVLDPDVSFTVMDYNALGQKTSMQTKDAGSWTYDYTPFGELAEQTDAKNQSIRYFYNQLGLPTLRLDVGFTNWIYHTTADHRLWLPATVDSTSMSESYEYDSLSRLSETETTIDGVTYDTSYTYRSSGPGTGKLWRIEYPVSTSGNTIRAEYQYDSMGSPIRVVDADTPSNVWYELKETDALGRIRHGTFRNGLDEVFDYDDATHRLKTIQTGPGMSASIQNLRYHWDTLGNLTQRNDDRQGLSETFTYDDLNRLETVTLGSTPTLSLTYSPGGNILTKSDVGTYSYAFQSKAVDSITGIRPATYTYDANGNRETANGDVITWDRYNMPQRIDYGSDYAEFEYGGADRQRTKQTAKTGANTVTTWYVGPHFEKETDGTVTTYRHNIFFGDRTVAIVEKPTTGGTVTHYVHRDHLNSVEAVTDLSGTVMQRFSFDAFGKRRNTNWTADPGDVRFGDAHATERGYTGHEHLDNVRLIHMNGRVLDPVIGRVISPDPFVPDPFNGQSYNRMSYVQNNPLSLVDPTGFEERPPGDDVCALFGWGCTPSYDWRALDWEPDKTGVILPPPGYVATPRPGPDTVPPTGDSFDYGDFTVGVGIGLFDDSIQMALDTTTGLRLQIIAFALGYEYDYQSPFVLPDSNSAILGNELAPAVAILATGGRRAARSGERLLLRYFSDRTLVCRGGLCKADNFSEGTGVVENADGTLSNVSTQARPGASVETLSQPFRNGRVGVTTAGRIRRAGGEVILDGTKGNPNHATVNGLSAEQLEALFTPTVTNPVDRAIRGTFPRMAPNN